MDLSSHILLFSEAKPSKKMYGGKGSGLIEMTSAGLNVPPGFVIDIEVCKEFNKINRLPDGLMSIVRKKMVELEKITKKNFGKRNTPLLVSVR